MLSGPPLDAENPFKKFKMRRTASKITATFTRITWAGVAQSV